MVYNDNCKLIEGGNYMYYDIVDTGVKGNCVIINDIMVDCGVPYDNIKDKLSYINYILLTHIHSDHLNIVTVNKIKELHPNILFVGNVDVNRKVNLDIVINNLYDSVSINLGNYIINTFKLTHEVMNHGYAWNYYGNHIIYATDTNELDNAPDTVYDYMFLECSYDEVKLSRASMWADYHGRLPFTRFGYHLSKQYTYSFYNKYKRDSNTVLIELHKSEMFY